MNGFERGGARASSWVCALAIMCVSSQAFALDGYQDRRKLFWGASLGGGVGLVNAQEPEDSTGLDQGRKLGLHVSGVVGGGVTQNITLGGEVSLWSREVRLNDSELAHNHSSFVALANLFLIEGLFLEGGAGFAYGAYDTVRGDGPPRQYGEMGLALKAGAGFEFFVNSQVALGVRANYTRHFYTNGDFDTVAGGATFRWY